MSFIPTIFRSTDAGAPILTGTAGSFAALMDAVLVSGYGVGAEAKAPLGWVRAFSAGHKRAYRNSLASGGTGFYWRIDDSNAMYVLNSGFHSMTGVDAGVDEFAAGGNGWSKSVTANTTPRDWVVIGNDRSIYIFVRNGGGGLRYTGYFVGDYTCLNKAYAFNFGITNTKVAAPAAGIMRSSLLSASNAYGVFGAARSFNGAVVGADMQPRTSLITNQADLGGAGAAPYPYPTTGAMLVSRVMLNSAGYLFGLLPGMWAPEHAGVLTAWTEYSDIAGVPGGRWLAVEAQAGVVAQGLLRIDAAWEY